MDVGCEGVQFIGSDENHRARFRFLLQPRLGLRDEKRINERGKSFEEDSIAREPEDNLKQKIRNDLR